MGVVEEVWNVAKDAVSLVAKGIKFSVDKLSDLIGYISDKLPDWIGKTEKTDDGYRLPLKPIKISLVAPSGAGKSSLISTVVWYLNNGGLEKGKGFDVKPYSMADAQHLSEFNKSIEALIHSNAKGKIRVNVLDGSANRRKFDFEIRAEQKKGDDAGNKLFISQPFSIMDIPGGWVTNPPDTKEYKEFKEHLRESRVLWIPIEAPFLQEATGNQQKVYAAYHLDTPSVQTLISEWAQYRKSDSEECSLFFVPMKCETYFSQGNKASSSDFRNNFMEFYKPLINQAKQLCPRCNIFYAPVETIGCIKINDSEWAENEDGSSPSHVLKAEYRIVDKERRIAGTEYLTQTIFKYAAENVERALEEAKNEKKEEMEKAPVVPIPLSKSKTKTKGDIKKELEAIEVIEKQIFAGIKDELKRLGEAASTNEYCQKYGEQLVKAD